MAKRKTIDESEIKAIVQAEIQNADGYQGTHIATERAQNLNAYFGRPYGNEVEGRSQVVSRDVQQNIEWQMPTYMRIFTSGEDVVSFEPLNPDDTEAAKQATEYVNYVFHSDNPGVRILYEWFKDALICKVGIIKIYWEEKKQAKRKRYEGLDKDAFAEVASPDDVTVSEHTENDDKTHDAVLTQTKTQGKVCIDNVPPEEFLISKDGRNIEDARLVGHRRQRTLSDLREAGFPKDKIDKLSEGYDSGTQALEEVTRNTVEDDTADTDDAYNKAMRTVWVTEAYIKIDVDGDGIAEMRKVVVAGPGYEILSNEAWDGPRPFATLTPIIMPHRFWGLCPADQSKDTQLIKTTLLRQFLDNAYQVNNQREIVVQDEIIDPDEVLTSAPGRKIRVKSRADAITPIPVQPIGEQIIGAMTYIDQIDEANTGVSERTQGLGANALHDTAAGERMMMTAAMGKIELIARVFAETGVKDAFRLILKNLVMYQKQPRMVKLSTGWAEISTNVWDPDMEMKVSVAVGMGDRDHQVMSAGMVGRMQQMLLPLGFISPDNIKNATELGLNGLGLKGVERFASFPQGDAAKNPIQLPPPNQKPGTDPQTLIQIEQIKNQGKAQVAQITAGARAKTDALHAQAQAATDQHANQLELQRHTLENRQAMQLEAFKAKMDTAVELAVAHIKAAAQIEAARIAAKASDGAEAEARESAGEAA